MKNKECDIIRDLLPSYVDEICSEASVEWIAGHLADCVECREMAERMRTTEISAKALEEEQLEAGRKVIRQNMRRSLLNFGLSVFMFAVLLCSFFWEGGLLLVVLLPVCMAMTWLVNRNQTKKRVWDKWDGISLAAALVAVGYGAAVMYYVFSRMTNGKAAFGAALSETGPALDKQLVAVILLCLVLYLVQFMRTWKQGRMRSVVMNVCLTGIFLMLSYCTLLGQLSDTEQAWKNLQLSTWVPLAVGIAGTVTFAFFDKREDKKERKLQ